jgi:hypothetical protein
VQIKPNRNDKELKEAGSFGAPSVCAGPKGVSNQWCLQARLQSVQTLYKYGSHFSLCMINH